MNRLLLALCVALAAVACSRPAAVTRDRIKFSHGPHLRAGQSCTSCHGALADPNAQGRPTGMPTEASCRACHTAPAQQQCSYCHTVPAAPQRFARSDRELTFSHARHSTRVLGNCVQCHGVGANTETVNRFEPRVPDMNGCLGSCHSDDMRALACNRCHQNLRRYPIESVSVVHHGPGFGRHHSVEARASGGMCAQCHEPTFCGQCHVAAPGVPLADLEATSVTRDFVHRGDFMARHPDEARFNNATCMRCHGADFCDGCHRASGVGGGVGPASTHPPGWLDPASPNGHARAARRNLLSCVSCHESDAVSVCAPCHRVGGVARSPHPPGFRAGIDAQQHAVCLACHEGSP